MMIGPLIFWYALDAALLDTILAGESLQLRIPAIANFERLASHSAIIGDDFRHCPYIICMLLDILFETHGGCCEFDLPDFRESLGCGKKRKVWDGLKRSLRREREAACQW